MNSGRVQSGDGWRTNERVVVARYMAQNRLAVVGKKPPAEKTTPQQAQQHGRNQWSPNNTERCQLETKQKQQKKKILTNLNAGLTNVNADNFTHD